MEFKPLLTPPQMLELGVFDGTYFKDDYSDFKEEVTVSSKNLFLEHASSPMSDWIKYGWLTPEDPIGWFQWYTRYYYGRRIPKLDEHQIKRWRSYTARHSAQVVKHGSCDLTIRAKQRQALLHWGCDPIPDVIDIEDKYEFLKEYKEQLTFCS